MKKVAISLILIFCVSSFAQSDGLFKKKWNPGEVFFIEGGSLSGEIQYDLDKNVVILKKDGKLKAYSVHSIDYFLVKDQKRKSVRKFYSMPYRLEDGQSRTMFFELVFNDNFALFNRGKTVRKQQAKFTEMPHVIDDEDQKNVEVFTYYVFTPEGNFRKIFTEENDLVMKLSLNRKEKKSLHRFIYDNDLDLKNRSDFIRVIYEFV